MKLPPLPQLVFATVVGVATGFYAFNEPLKQYALANPHVARPATVEPVEPDARAATNTTSK